MTATERRVRFEVRVVGVAKTETLHFDHLLSKGQPLPKRGELAGPPRTLIGRRRVTAVKRAPAASNVAAVVRLDPIDCGQLELDYDLEVAALRDAGWNATTANAKPKGPRARNLRAARRRS